MAALPVACGGCGGVTRSQLVGSPPVAATRDEAASSTKTSCGATDVGCGPRDCIVRGTWPFLLRSPRVRSAASFDDIVLRCYRGGASGWPQRCGPWLHLAGDGVVDSIWCFLSSFRARTHAEAFGYSG
ncbi:hypothetical protein E2562_016060 [Oryza meyeriana var. granulata]|uniref:Uncharacterized protein n=1 Tax=Oryza meyeriana var. granulata TaxID=110450 RepID=A0A6G1BKY6_9ORYZ|nr:hypothetical protein E2562_016059 [Oryza meyeriana var. granulata]KAF0888591.1 hypothetical protein E2562_016060 [Oryza meyeriana var. granulata]